MDLRQSMSVILLAFLLSPLAALADYSFQIIDPVDDALWVQTFGINDKGIITGGVMTEDFNGFNFELDLRTGEYVKRNDMDTVLEINNAGTIVGQLTPGVCGFRDRKGSISTFYPPSTSAFSFCSTRGVNERGLMTGFIIDEDRFFRGFIYDSKRGAITEFLPSRQTIAHGLNNRGQNVGSVRLDPGQVHEGSYGGIWGFVRELDGTVKYVTVLHSNQAPTYTRLRGINDQGLVAGWFIDPTNGIDAKSFVTPLQRGGSFELISLTEDELVFQKPCDPDAPEPPSPDYETYTLVAVSQIRNDGVLVGNCIDYLYHSETGTLSEHYRGFVATPN